MYNSNFNVTRFISSSTTTGINDLAPSLVSCWTPNNSVGRLMTLNTSGQYLFPSYNYANLFSGQIISINNNSSSTITIAISNNGIGFCTIQNGTSYYDGTKTFTISKNTLNTYVLTGGTFFVRIATSTSAT